MPLSLLPKMILPALTDVTAEMLHSRNIRLLMLDFDNTIVPYSTDVPTEKMENWIRDMLASDIQVCLVSNTKRERVVHFCNRYGLDLIMRAKKPFGKGIAQCLSRYSIPASQAALVGDQIYTDTLGANLNGVTSILVTAINNHNILLKARHVLEMPFILMAWNRRVLK